MDLVVDTNPVISALIVQGVSQDLLCHSAISCVAPDWLLFELGKHWEDVHEKTGLSRETVTSLLQLLREHIETVNQHEYAERMARARTLASEEKDAEFFALAMERDCAIWSDDTGFKDQDEVAVYTTSELYELFLD